MPRLISFVLFLFIYTFGYSQDTLYAYFVYGSKPLKETESNWFGGKLGGHVGLGINRDSVYHFNPGGHVGAFGKKDQPGTWLLDSAEDFLCTFGCDSNKILVVSIPVSHTNWMSVKEKGNTYLYSPSYPYAFFGMRCTAACYDLLSQGGVVKTRSKSGMIRKNFYPRKLRKRLLKMAKEKGWNTELTPGRVSRKWDHD